MSNVQHDVMHFAVHPSVLFKLGEDLITDDAQALAELIKNSYDADARTVRVNIDTKGWFDRETGSSLDYRGDSRPSASTAVRGRISVTDDGTGMTPAAIERGWLTVSYSAKRGQKAKGETTRLERTPLGDKGLGRLGAQRLGAVLSLETTPVEQVDDQKRFFGTSTSSLVVDWARFMNAETLEKVTLDVTTLAGERRPAGSVVSIIGLTDAEFWTERAREVLERELTSILSPYDTAGGLQVFVTIDADQLDLRQRARKVLDAAPFRLRFAYENGTLHVETDTSFVVLLGRKTDDKIAFDRLVVADRGAAFATWLLTKKSKKAEELGAEYGDDRAFIRSATTMTLEELTPARVNTTDPGRFSGEISALNFDAADESLFSGKAELKDFAKHLLGVRVFRDGFGIRLQEDWLGLSKQQTTGSSFYGLRPGNTAGYVNLTARDNKALEETSSREAFRDTAAWRGFHALMTGIADYARNTQDFVRRNWNEYKASFDLSPELEELATPREIVEHIERQMDAAKSTGSRLNRVASAVPAIERAIKGISEVSAANETAVWRDDKITHLLDQVAEQLNAVQADLANSLTELNEITREQQALRAAARLLSSKIGIAEERISLSWESVALGLSAELLAHDVDAIGDRLRGRSVQILNYQKGLERSDPRVLSYAEHVRSSAGELIRQVSRLDSSLRYRREHKSTRWVGELVGEAAEFFNDRWKQDGIRFVVEVVEDFEVTINAGKFSQVMDNLAINAHYWVSRHMRSGHISDGLITCIVSAPVVHFTDNGPGVSARVDDSLFEAFVTTKPRGDGRGLGLYVVSQLLDSEGATIHLSGHRNADQRHDTFEIDLSSISTGARTRGHADA